MKERRQSAEPIPDDLTSRRDQMLAENAAYRDAYQAAEQIHNVVDALVDLRKRLGLTQTDMAHKMGVKQPTVSGFETESSDPRISTLQRYSKAVGAKLDILVVHDLLPGASGESELSQVTDEEIRVAIDSWSLSPTGATRGRSTTEPTWTYEISDAVPRETLSGAISPGVIDLELVASTTEDGQVILRGSMPLPSPPSPAVVAVLKVTFGTLVASIRMDEIVGSNRGPNGPCDIVGSVQIQGHLPSDGMAPRIVLTFEAIS